MISIYSVNIEGSVESIKTKYSHPYNYDPIIQYQASGTANKTFYSDRLFQWDHQKHNSLCKNHFGNMGQFWDSRDPVKIEAFLRDWTNDPNLKLISITEYCNLASGYPIWRFDAFQE